MRGTDEWDGWCFRHILMGCLKLGIRGLRFIFRFMHVSSGDMNMEVKGRRIKA